MTAGRSGGLPGSFRLLVGGVVLAAAVGLSGCGGSDAAVGSPAPAPGATVVDEAAPPAPVGRPARSTRVRFVPERVELPDGGAATVQPAATVDGELVVPENVRHVGWWDGSAWAGDPFGSTVIAGHVDSATGGLGFFARLLDVRRGETVVLRGDGHRQAYRVTSIRTIKKGALATGSDAFDQESDHRLVLITCGGKYQRDRGGYDSNVVVTAKPVGLAR